MRTGVYVLLLTGAIIPSIILRGFVLKVLWGWFLVPWLTPTAPGVVLCMGIATIFTLFAGLRIIAKTPKRKPPTRIGMSLDVEKLPVDQAVKQQLRALQENADVNMAYDVRETLMTMITTPFSALAIGWVLKHFL
jgi:hypothetical protein